MKIRDKLLLGFGLYIVLATVLGFFAYRELLTIRSRLLLVEIADDISNTSLEVRRYEKNYLLYKDPDDLVELKKYIENLKKNIEAIRSEINSGTDINSYSEVKMAIAGYLRLVDAIEENFNAQSKITLSIIEAGVRAERAYLGKSLEKFLVLRRYEKNIMLYKDEKSYNVFKTTFDNSSLTRHPEAIEYQALVTRLYRLYGEERATVEKMRVTAREIQSFTERLSKKERTDISTTITFASHILLSALLLIIILGIVINVKLATSIAAPIRNLEKITIKIAEGDFSQNIEVKGKDEIASLELAFNQMEERLKDALTSLEYTIEKLKEKQAQLVEAEKLASVGILCKGIAHEINNPLTSVLTFSNLMLEQTPPDDPRADRLKLMARETERARGIVRQLLNFGKEIDIKPVRLDVNKPVSEIVDSFIAQDAFKDIELRLNLSSGLPDVHADPAQLGQVVQNIVLNAIHAVTPPGWIEISTRAGEKGDKKGDKFVEMVFEDSGPGIPQEHINKIFDPFFTTKEATKGTGLGLAVSYGIIKKHGGDITVTSEAGRGAVFIVRLPIYG